MAENSGNTPKEIEISKDLANKINKKMQGLDPLLLQNITNELEGKPKIKMVDMPPELKPPPRFEDFYPELEELFEKALAVKRTKRMKHVLRDRARGFFDRFRPIIVADKKTLEGMKERIAELEKSLEVLKTGKIKYMSNRRSGFIALEDITQVEENREDRTITIVLKNGLSEKFDRKTYWWLYRILFDYL